MARHPLEVLSSHPSGEANTGDGEPEDQAPVAEQLGKIPGLVPWYAQKKGPCQLLGGSSPPSSDVKDSLTKSCKVRGAFAPPMVPLQETGNNMTLPLLDWANTDSSVL